MTLLPVWILLMVVIHQRWRMRKHHQTAWKGGGFGMFSDIHTTSVTAGLLAHDPGGELRDWPVDIDEWLSRVNVIPNDRNLRSWGTEILRQRWRTAGGKAVPVKTASDSQALVVQAVTLRHFKIDFDRGSGAYTSLLQTVVVVETPATVG